MFHVNDFPHYSLMNYSPIKLRQENGRYFTNYRLKCIIMEQMSSVFISISLIIFIAMTDELTLVQDITWHWTGY